MVVFSDIFVICTAVGKKEKEKLQFNTLMNLHQMLVTDTMAEHPRTTLLQNLWNTKRKSNVWIATREISIFQWVAIQQNSMLSALVLYRI